jgi:hypothetical protein
MAEVIQRPCQCGAVEWAFESCENDHEDDLRCDRCLTGPYVVSDIKIRIRRSQKVRHVWYPGGWQNIPPSGRYTIEKGESYRSVTEMGYFPNGARTIRTHAEKIHKFD